MITGFSSHTPLPHLWLIHARFLFFLPTLGLLGWMTASGAQANRRKCGWQTLRLLDVVAVPVFVVLTLFLGYVFPGDINGIESPDFLARTVSIISLSILLAGIEELYFRSWLLTRLMDIGWPKSCAVAISVLLFAYLHIWQGWRVMLFAGIVGFLYSLYFLKRRCIITLIASHSLHNILAILLS